MSGRRTQGTGSIIRRGKTYTVVLDLGRGPDDRRIRRWHPGYTTKKAAEKGLVDLLAKLERGEYVEPDKDTFGAYLERWLEYKAGRVEPETVERYRELLTDYVIPRIGHVKVQKLKPLHLVDLYAALGREGRRRRRRKDGAPEGLSPRTILHVHRAINGALRQAVKWHVVAANVALAVDPPAVPEVPMVTLSHEQARTLMAGADGLMRALVHVALATGMRRGELAALRWSHVDLEAGTVRVEAAVRATKKVGTRIKAPKTQAGRREVVLPAFAVAELRRHRAQQKADRLACGGAYDLEADRVFAREDGAPLSPDALTHRFRTVADRAGLPRSVHLHTLRHSAASFLAAEGTSASDIAAVLGHADGGGLAMRVYVHPLPEAQARAAARLERALGDAAGE